MGHAKTMFSLIESPPLDLGPLGKRIRKSPSFRFESLWFRVESPEGERMLDTTVQAMQLLRHIVQGEGVQNEGVQSDKVRAVLQKSFDPMYDDRLTLELPHEHSRFVHDRGAVESLLAQAAADRLGPYSRRSPPESKRERQAVEKLFAKVGAYEALELQPGSVEGCPKCRSHENNLFSTWFYGVAWDWCFVVLWPDRHLACLILMTATD